MASVIVGFVALKHWMTEGCCDAVLITRRRQWSCVLLCCWSVRTLCHDVTMATGHAGWRCLEACPRLVVSLLDADAIYSCRELLGDTFTSGLKSVQQFDIADLLPLCKQCRRNWWISFLDHQYFVAVTDAKYCDQDVCLFVSLSACISHARPDFIKFSVPVI